MKQADIESTHGDVLTAISDGMVALLKEFYGRGPTRTKSYSQLDAIIRAQATGVLSGTEPDAGERC
jgi:uncharacterized protein YbcI